MHMCTRIYFSDLYEVILRHALGARRSTHSTRYCHTFGRIGVSTHGKFIKNHTGSDELLDVCGADFFEANHGSGNGLTQILHTLIVQYFIIQSQLVAAIVTQGVRLKIADDDNPIIRIHIGTAR